MPQSLIRIKFLNTFSLCNPIRTTRSNKTALYNLKCGRNFYYFFTSLGKPVSKSNPVSTRSPAWFASFCISASLGLGGASPSYQRWKAILPSHFGNFAGGKGTISSKSWTLGRGVIIRKTIWNNSITFIAFLSLW